MKFGERSKYLLRGMQNRRLTESADSLMETKGTLLFTGAAWARFWSFPPAVLGHPLGEEQGNVGEGTDSELAVWWVEKDKR